MRNIPIAMSLALGLTIRPCCGAEDVLHAESYGDLALVTMTSATRVLEDRKVYVLTNSLTFAGADAENPSCAGAPGLSVASNATAYVAIPMGLTLTCCGGRGCDGTPGEPARSAPVSSETSDISRTAEGKTLCLGVRVQVPFFDIPAGGDGGTGATGGGPGIFVPAGARLVVFGDGTLDCRGGAGGNAAVGGDGANGLYYVLSLRQSTRGSELESRYPPPDATNFTASAGLTMRVEGVCTNAFTLTGWNESYMNGQPASGGGGGGGAGGGGAAIGEAGAFGGRASSGARSANRFNDGDVAVVSASAPVSPSAAFASGEVLLAVANTNLVGGAGGVAAAAKTALGNVRELGAYFTDNYGDTVVNTNFFTAGQPGGAGGAGGAGACVGAGGTGGTGGTGGDSGSLVDSACSKATTFLGVSQVGVAGSTGAGGTAVDPGPLPDGDSPYNRIACVGGATVRYGFLRGAPVALPAAADTNLVIDSWRTRVFARAVPGLENTSSALLPDDGTCYDLGSSVTPGKATYGDVVLSGVPIRVACDGRKCPLVVPTDGDFYRAHLQGKTTDAMREFLDGVGSNGCVRWQSYVAGLDVTNALSRVGLSPTQVSARALELTPFAYASATNMMPLSVRYGVGFNVSYRYASTNDVHSAAAGRYAFLAETNAIPYRIEMKPLAPGQSQALEFYSVRLNFTPDGN